eukprot:TRINITY_DN9413_c0_g1_i1.p1 TRINITY_DN9413_c0_g1~~TRINITY_DN9413_c0_g1_i1.p1  ORF type:complete len:552 (+),score=96.65 TRINITY_DN9413_c0_g1_i1:50-1657(+)
MFRAWALLLTLQEVVALPHIVFVVGDNIGWANVGWHEGYTNTDSMDKLVSEGIELQRHYVHMSSSPTRASFLSGRLPLHVSENQTHSCNEQGSIPVGMATIAEKLKKAGYKTHQIGKWDVGGFGDQFGLPISKGFDQSFGFLGGSEDHYTRKSLGCGCSQSATDLWQSSGPASGFKNDTTYSSDFYFNQINNTLSAHTATDPIFLFVGAQGAGAPLQADRFAKAYENETTDFANYNGMVSSVDSLVSNIVSKLKEKQMWENTLFVFTSDSGGDSIHHFANNYPLKGGLGSSWEGGVRVPTFVSGGLIPQDKRGGSLSGMMHITDWYATFCRLAGVDPTDADAVSAGLPAVDSIDQWDYIIGTQEPRRTELVISSARSSFSFGGKDYTGSAAFIRGDLKLVRGMQANCLWFSQLYPNSSSTPPTDGSCDCADGCLYNISSDPNEMIDIRSTAPIDFASIQQRALQLDNTSIEFGRSTNWRKELNLTLSCDQPNHNGGFWGPYVNDPPPTLAPVPQGGGGDSGMSTGAKVCALFFNF